jgi:hypothetical protein
MKEEELKQSEELKKTKSSKQAKEYMKLMKSSLICGLKGTSEIQRTKSTQDIYVIKRIGGMQRTESNL